MHATMFKVLIVALASTIAGQAIAESGSKEALAPLTAARPIHPERWVTTDDRLNSGSDGEGVTRFELTVSPVGGVVNCEVTQSSGYSVLDQLTCSLLMKRGRFLAARDQNGQAVASTWRNMVRWIKPEHSGQPLPPPPTPDMELTVTRLPPSVKSPARVRVLAVSSSKAELEACTKAEDEGSDALTRIACQQLATSGLLRDFQNSHSPSQRIMRAYTIAFATEAGGSQQ